jgi:hypothetical protein
MSMAALNKEVTFAAGNFANVGTFLVKHGLCRFGLGLIHDRKKEIM